MESNLFELNDLRMEISFKTFEELRYILSFYNKNNLYKINIPCKKKLKKDFLISSIKIAREEFPFIDIIPHFSILHEFKKNRSNTFKSFIDFLDIVKNLGCREVLLVSGSQKRSTLDSVSTLNLAKNHPLITLSNISIGVAFNPYLAGSLFENELIRIQNKIKTGLVNSIWIQFGTDYSLLEARIKILEDIIVMLRKTNPKLSNINLFGSILLPSKQFLASFKYRPWKGVYCSSQFLESVEYAEDLITKLLITYKIHNICPIIENNTSTEKNLELLKKFI